MSTKRITIKFEATLDELAQLKMLALQLGFDTIPEYMLYGMKEFIKQHANTIAKVRKQADELAATTDTGPDTQGNTTTSGST